MALFGGQKESKAEEMYGSNIAEFGMILSSSGEDSWKISYLRTLIEQNWIIIRQLDRLNSAIAEKQSGI